MGNINYTDLLGKYFKSYLLPFSQLLAYLIYSETLPHLGCLWLVIGVACWRGEKDAAGKEEKRRGQKEMRDNMDTEKQESLA